MTKLEKIKDIVEMIMENMVYFGDCEYEEDLNEIIRLCEESEFK